MKTEKTLNDLKSILWNCPDDAKMDLAGVCLLAYKKATLGIEALKKAFNVALSAFHPRERKKILKWAMKFPEDALRTFRTHCEFTQ